VVEQRALALRPAAVQEAHEAVVDHEPVAIALEAELRQRRRGALDVADAQLDVVEVVVELAARPLDQPQHEAFVRAQGGEVAVALGDELLRQPLQGAGEVAHAQHDPHERADVARRLGVEERELALAGIDADQREAVGALDLVHAEVIAQQRGVPIPLGGPQSDMVERGGAHRVRSSHARHATHRRASASGE
jgi:hypothetical protein